MKIQSFLSLMCIVVHICVPVTLKMCHFHKNQNRAFVFVATCDQVYVLNYFLSLCVFSSEFWRHNIENRFQIN